VTSRLHRGRRRLGELLQDSATTLRLVPTWADSINRLRLRFARYTASFNSG
jgi:hypothetical protein